MSKQWSEGSASQDPHSGPTITEASPSYDAIAPRRVTTEERENREKKNYVFDSKLSRVMKLSQ